MASSAAALVEEALLSVEADPGRAERLATTARDEADAADDHATASAAERALGLARREVHDLDGAWHHFQTAVRRAADHGLDGAAGLARMSLAGVLAYRGHFHKALQQAQRAADQLQGRDRSEAVLQCGNILFGLGRAEEALERYRVALPGLRRHGDRLSQARLHNNRGLLLIDLGRWTEAEDDLLRSERLYQDLGQARTTAFVRSHLGNLALRRGDLPAALGWLERSDAECAALGITDLFGLVDRCPALLSARLASEARTALTAAIGPLEDQGMAPYVADARLLLAESFLLEGDVENARNEAAVALELFRQQRRRPHVARAEATMLRIDFARGERSPLLLAKARRAARSLDRCGLAVDALDARITAARIALDLGRRRVARSELAGTTTGKGPVQVRSRAWHAQALLRLAAGNPAGAERALGAGLRVLDSHRASLGATELRANAAGHGADLAEDGLRLAVSGGRPARVLAWAERWRAAAMLLPPVRPPDDAALADLLAELRAVVKEAEAVTLAGRDAASLRRRQARLEETVRRRARLAPGADRGSTSVPTVPRLLEALGQQGMVELVRVDDELHAVVVARGRARFRFLGPAAPVMTELGALRFALRRLALRRGNADAMETAALALADAARRLDALLVQPLERDLDGCALVMVPTGPLHALPWAVLPSCVGRTVSVSPSAAVWLRAACAADAKPRRARIGTVLVAGPGLPHAEAEVATLGRRIGGATCLTGDAATAEAVTRAIDGAGLVHIACHGSFRADNPLFSCLTLADGPLTVYDLEALTRVPTTLVLSSCDVGLSTVRPGDELTGLASALLSLGTRSVVASVAPVADDATARLMSAFHTRLLSGEGPAGALARAQAEVEDPGAAFVCFGAG